MCGLRKTNERRQPAERSRYSLCDSEDRQFDVVFGLLVASSLHRKCGLVHIALTPIYPHIGPTRSWYDNSSNLRRMDTKVTYQKEATSPEQQPKW